MTEKAVTIRHDDVQGYVLHLSIPGLGEFGANNQVLSLALTDLAEQLENEGV